MTATLQLTEQLISMASVTPLDGGCQALIADRLRPLGFVCETIESGPDDFRVTNLWARLGTGQQPTLIFAGHTDVVPVEGQTLEEQAAAAEFERRAPAAPAAPALIDKSKTHMGHGASERPRSAPPPLPAQA